MNVLFIGDVVGKSGCDFLRSKLSAIKHDYSVDFTIVNGENSAQGNGITPFSAQHILSSGADVITTGNHAFKRHEAAEIYDNDIILRPQNYPDGCIGKGVCTVDIGITKIAVVNISGTVYLDPLDNPFTTADKVLKTLDTPNIFVDFHAEATAEKKAMGYHLAGKVTAVLGTHTHVQTADETILSSHTAYITDAGMTGAENSVLGVKNELAVQKMRLHYPVRFEESDEPCFINGVITDFDETTGAARSIERIILR